MNKPTKKQVIQGRKCWRPQRPEMLEQCVSCPFRTDNLVEFRVVLCKIAEVSGHPKPSLARAAHAIVQVKTEDAVRGDFICHQSIYTPEFDGRREQDQWRQCRGASEYYRSGEDL